MASKKNKKPIVKLASEVYYYIRDAENHPRGTVCIARCDDTGDLVKGLALCSMSEMPVKKTGRQTARRMAIIAANRKRNSNEIERDEAIQVLAQLDMFDWTHRSIYRTMAETDFEQKLIDNHLAPDPT